MFTNKSVAIAAIIGAFLAGLSTTLEIADGNGKLLPFTKSINGFPAENYLWDQLDDSCKSPSTSGTPTETNWNSCFQNAMLAEKHDSSVDKTESKSAERNPETTGIGYSPLKGNPELKASLESIPVSESADSVIELQSRSIGPANPKDSSGQAKNLNMAGKQNHWELSQLNQFSDSDSGKCLDFNGKIARLLQTGHVDGKFSGVNYSKNGKIDCKIPLNTDSDPAYDNFRATKSAQVVNRGLALQEWHSFSAASNGDPTSNSNSIGANQSESSFETAVRNALTRNYESKSLNRDTFEEWPVPKPKPKFLNRTAFKEWPVPKPKPKPKFLKQTDLKE